MLIKLLENLTSGLARFFGSLKVNVLRLGFFCFFLAYLILLVIDKLLVKIT